LLNAKAGQALNKYVLLTQSSLGDSGALMKERYKVGNYSFLIVTPENEVIVKYTGHPSSEKVSAAVEGTADFRQGMADLEKLKTKKVSENANAIGKALKQIGKIDSPEAYQAINAYVKDTTTPEVLRATAIGALEKQSAAAKELVEFLNDKKQANRAAATTALKSMGMDAMEALLDGLASDNGDLRVTIFNIAAPMTKNPKISRDQGLWKAGKPADREKALKEWRDWYHDAITPKDPKDEKKPATPKK
jgi:hypothetical protein